jgi:hypothetical protein
MARSQANIHEEGLKTNSVSNEVPLKRNICTSQLPSANSTLNDKHLYLFTLQSALSVLREQVIYCVKFTASDVTTVFANGHFGPAQVVLVLYLHCS